MKVILKQDIKGVGRKNEVINASDGYARNFLFPKNLAIEANAENMNKLNMQNEAKQYKKDVEKEQAKEIAKKLETIILQIKVQAGENGKIFGSVSSKEITENLESQYKIRIDKKKVDLKEAIKTTGLKTVEVKLFEGVTGKIKINVIS
ncbi:MAG: 50S ribosomal protein L9 [Clostridia bacterium]|nr:50S ribosomal protein L9 [Clostridia bacterium]